MSGRERCCHDCLYLMGSNTLLLRRGPHGQRGSGFIWYVPEVVSGPVIEGRAEGEAVLFV